MATKRTPRALLLATNGFILLWLILAAFPFLWTAWGSFKVELDFFSISNWTDALTGPRTTENYGAPFTLAAYDGAWVQEGFWRPAINTFIVCFFVVCTSLTIGTLGGYALSRSNFRYAFWLLIAALIALILWLLFRDRGEDGDDRGPKDPAPPPPSGDDAERPKEREREDA